VLLQELAWQLQLHHLGTRVISYRLMRGGTACRIACWVAVHNSKYQRVSCMFVGGLQQREVALCLLLMPAGDTQHPNTQENKVPEK
jgi:hypothetical protein